MRATSIPRHESSFRTSGIDCNGKKHALKPFTVKVPGSSETVKMVECTLETGDQSFFYKEVVPKQRVVLHYTAGYLKGDIGTLTTPGNHVSVPFVVARDGTIYNLWTSKYWSYHLGPGAQGGNTAMSKSSIGIEISNIGWLQRKGDDLVTYFSETDVYSSLDEPRHYEKTATFRGKQYFATYTDAQYESVIKLLRFLTAKYDIPRVFLPSIRRYGVLPEIASYRGISSHVNYRPSGKWDIGPAFDWERVMAGVSPG
jgi:N-acetyl-anhydromuramyl-L-alanine amidase AmpD